MSDLFWKDRIQYLESAFRCNLDTEFMHKVAWEPLGQRWLSGTSTLYDFLSTFPGVVEWPSLSSSAPDEIIAKKLKEETRDVVTELIFLDRFYDLIRGRGNQLGPFKEIAQRIWVREKNRLTEEAEELRRQLSPLDEELDLVNDSIERGKIRDRYEKARPQRLELMRLKRERETLLADKSPLVASLSAILEKLQQAQDKLSDLGMLGSALTGELTEADTDCVRFVFRTIQELANEVGGRVLAELQKQELEQKARLRALEAERDKQRSMEEYSREYNRWKQKDEALARLRA